MDNATQERDGEGAAPQVWPPPPVGLVAPTTVLDPAVAEHLRRSRNLSAAGCLTMPLFLPVPVLLILAVRNGLRASALGGGIQGAGAVAEALVIGFVWLVVWGGIAALYLTGLLG